MFNIRSRTDLRDPARFRKMKIRKEVADQIKRHIMERVSQRGMGADGPLNPYSEQGLVILKPSGGAKPKVKPARGWGKYHEGGYRQYREEAGLETDKFVFSNKGAAWRDWMQGQVEESGPMDFGFGDERNTMAADEATKRKREDMFDLNEAEADKFLEAYLDAFLREVWGTNTETS